MARPDLNLLFTLDVLLAEGSVARAARRLRLSPSAMSRALARLREATGDPLLVRAGRGLVPSPRAIELRERVSQLVHDAEAALRPATSSTSAQLDRTFTLRTSEGFVENFGATLLARVSEEAPGVRLRFLPKLDKDSAPLRDGSVDLETGVVGKTTGPGSAGAGVVSRPLRRRRAHRAPAERGQDHSRPLCRRTARPVSRGEVATRARSTTPWLARTGTSDCHDRRRLLGGAGAGSSLRSGRQRSRTAHRRLCAPACTASRCRCPFRRSRFHCSGIRGWMAIPRIAGFVGVFETPVRGKAESQHHGEPRTRIESPSFVSPQATFNRTPRRMLSGIGIL